ncbi:MAG: GAF domain-containing sensor histidine kinase [Deltaproteobacteria bacterium]|nr:GAF domain-containing sensor histidine kinase [Deltaproteobacteria bacterium]
MIEANKPANEGERLSALDAYQILDTDPEQAFDDLTEIASRICGTPIALVSLVDQERQWFKSKVGLEAAETPRRVAFCSHAILEPDKLLIVPDPHRDIRFADNPLVTSAPKIRFYAGAPLVNPEGQALGTLCVIDREPRNLEPHQIDTLRALARQVIGQMELRKKYIELRELALDLESNKHELERRNTEISTFYHTLAHELKTPLTAVREFVSIVMDQIAGPVTKDQREYLGTAKICCDQIKTHIDDLLDVTRLETGKLALDQKISAMVRIIELVVSSTLSAARDKQLVLRKQVPSDLPPVLVDERRIAQVLTNLVSNAIKFTPPRGEIVVSARHDCEEDVIVVEVSDTGVGIEAQHCERIFDRLYQVKKDDAAIKGGLGIGLSLCREIVKLHGGSITVESELEKGSRFIFSLPVAAACKSSSTIL